MREHVYYFRYPCLLATRTPFQLRLEQIELERGLEISSEHHVRRREGRANSEQWEWV